VLLFLKTWFNPVGISGKLKVIGWSVGFVKIISVDDVELYGEK